MRVHLRNACEKAAEYEKTKSITTAVECAKELIAWLHAEADKYTETTDEQ